MVMSWWYHTTCSGLVLLLKQVSYAQYIVNAWRKEEFAPIASLDSASFGKNICSHNALRDRLILNLNLTL